MSYETRHTIRVRYQNGTHQAVDDRTWVKCSSTSGHRQAAVALLKKQGFDELMPVRRPQGEAGLRDPKRKRWEQWQLFDVVLRKCAHCGCTDLAACVTEGVPCHWVADNLCSACAAKMDGHG